MRVFDNIVVCLPTVPERAAVLAETLRQWGSFGVAPVVELQPADWPLSGASHRRTSERALRRALDERPAASHVLFCEDDIDLAQELPTWLPAICWLDAPVTLFLALAQHYPGHVRRQLGDGTPVSEGMVALRMVKEWWGTQAVVLPRGLVEAVLCWESGRTGWDMQLQNYLLVQRIPLYVTVPNLAQQRGVLTVMPTSTDGGAHHSQTFGLPSTRSAISPPAPDTPRQWPVAAPA
jgi:hypothetical protein